MRRISLLLAFLAGYKPSIPDNERHARVALRTIADAEFDFRANDRNLNKLHEFWTGDVADLVEYGLIPPEIGMTDGSHPRPKPYHGYLFVAMELDEDGQPYRAIEGARNVSRFGVCAPGCVRRAGCGAHRHRRVALVRRVLRRGG